MKQCGIYCITNIKNNKRYIGQSVNIKKRFYSHRYSLKKQIHINKHLQSAWNKYGRDNFKFEILKECSRDELNKYEIEFIKKYDTTNPQKGYNHELGGRKNKKVSLHSKLKRRTGKWAHSLNPKTHKNYAFRNLCSELWNLRKFRKDWVVHDHYVFLPLQDINKQDDDLSNSFTSDDYMVGSYSDFDEFSNITMIEEHDRLY